MPAQIKYVVATGHSLSGTTSVSAALHSDGGVNSLAPNSKMMIGTIKCALTAGSHLSEGEDVFLYLSSDSAGHNPITPRVLTELCKVTGGNGSQVSGFAANFDVHTIINDSVYVVCKLKNNDTAIGAWTLYYRQGG